MIKPYLYGYPVLMRAGLGNMLIPWARCVIWCKDNNAQMIAPYWAKIRIGPFLRRERDKRQYQFLFNHTNQIAGLKRVIILALCRKIDEADWHNGTVEGKSDRIIVCFRNMDRADTLVGRHTEVADELFRITKPRYRPKNLTNKPFIGIHVRLGDFIPASKEELNLGLHCIRIPIQWYADALLELRKSVGKNMDAKIFSDGQDEELMPILRIPGTSRYEGGSAITDMLALSKATVIIASGSSFSIWASYLGGVPAIWHPGQRFSIRCNHEGENRDVEWDNGKFLDNDFIRLINF